MTTPKSTPDKTDAKPDKAVEAMKAEVAENANKELEQGYRGVTPNGPADAEYSLLSGPDGPPIHTETLRAIESKEANHG